MKKHSNVIFLVTVLVCAAFLSSQAGEIYRETFNNPPASTLGDLSWKAYLTGGSTDEILDYSETTLDVAGVADGDYGYYAPKNSSSTLNAGPGLLWTDSLVPMMLSDMEELSIWEDADNATGDEATMRFAVRVGTDWYVSDTSFGSVDDTPGTNILSLADWTDGSNWRALSVSLGASPTGELTVAETTLAGDLFGKVTAVGFLAYPGNNGDHFRFDDFAVSATLGNSLYLEPFNNSAGVPVAYSNYGWSSYVIGSETNEVLDSPLEDVAGVAIDGYGFYAPRLSSSYIGSGVGLFFTGDVEDIALAKVSVINFTQRCDATSTDPASGRAAVKIDGQWYVSETLFSNTADPSTYSPVSLILSDWTDGNNWYALTANPGAAPEGALEVADTPVGGTLSGIVTDFGVFLDPGKTDGDHARFDDFEIRAYPTPVLSLATGGDQVTVSAANMVPGVQNILQYKDSLLQETWTEVAVTGAVSSADWILSATNAAGFYRIIENN